MKTTYSTATASDLELEERVRIFLNQRNMPSLRRVSVSAENGTIRLRGRLRTYYEKQLCVSCCKHVAGVIKIVDETRVEKKATALSRLH